MNWLKLYHEARTDKKLATLADDEHRVWFNLLILASEQEEHRGEVMGLDYDLLALEVSGADVDLLTRTLTKLQRLRIVSVGNAHIKEGNALVTPHVAFLAFDKRQHVKPSDRPERVRERVARSRAQGNASDQGSNAPETPTPLHVTPRNAHRAEKNRVERDTETVAKATVAPKGAERKRTDEEVALHRAVWETLRTGISEVRTKPAASLRAAKCWELVEAGYSPDSVQAAVKAWSAHYPDIALTDAALVKHIDRLSQQAAPSRNGTPKSAEGRNLARLQREGQINGQYEWIGDPRDDTAGRAEAPNHLGTGMGGRLPEVRHSVPRLLRG